MNPHDLAARTAQNELRRFGLIRITNVHTAASVDLPGRLDEIGEFYDFETDVAVAAGSSVAVVSLYESAFDPTENMRVQRLDADSVGVGPTYRSKEPIIDRSVRIAKIPLSEEDD